MIKAPVTSIERGRKLVEEKAAERIATSQMSREVADGLKLLGAVEAGLNISRAVSSRALRVLQSFIEGKGYEPLGFETLTDFLNNSPDSPMTKNQYYDRLEILDKEGDVTFDLLNNLRIPVSVRKLLSDGAIQIEGNEIIVGEERASLDDRPRVKEIIKTLAETNAEQTRIIERGKKDIDKWKRKADEAKKNGHGEATPYEQAFNDTAAALVRLAAEAKELPNDARPAASDRMLRTIAPLYSTLMHAFRLDEEDDDHHLSDKRVSKLMED